MYTKRVFKCRVCGNPNLHHVINLGEQYLQGSFVKPGCQNPPMRKLPTELVRCDLDSYENACGLLQLANTFPQEILYANYWYRSGTNQTMRDHLRGIAEQARAYAPARQNLSVLDIGCNDGTLLACYPETFTRYGVDPSDIARSIPAPTRVINTVFPSPETAAALGQHKIDIITSIAMFYDLDDPVTFAAGVRDLLAEDGVWVLELSYMPLMLVRNSFDTICHEHLEYYSLSALEQIMARANLKIFKVELNEINGGSIRCYVKHEMGKVQNTPEDRDFIRWLRIHEFEMELDTAKPYAQFQQRIERLRDATVQLLTDIRSRGERIHVYGASTKGNVLLQWYGLNRLWIEAASDRNPDKDGAHTLGTDIPIVSEEKSRNMRPDWYLVLPWHFKLEFLQRERETIRSGVKMLFPLPSLQVVDANNVDAAIAELQRKAQSGNSAVEALNETVF